MKPAAPSRPQLADSRLAKAGWAIVTPVALWCEKHPRLKVLAGIGAFFLAIAGIVLFGIYLHFDRIADSYDLEKIAVMPEESTVYDVHGDVIGYLHGDGRTIVSLEKVAPDFKKALLAREDKRFFRHNGVDTIGAIRAWLRNTREGEVVQGASTLTMQLARNTFGMEEQTMRRKVIEMALARKVENEYSKEQILEIYMNRIFFGSGLKGIEQAAQGYFDKPASDLTLSESAMIAGIIRAPNRFSPYRQYEEALGEMHDTLDRMLDEDVITESEAEVAKAERPKVKPQSHSRSVILGKRAGRLDQDSYLLEAIVHQVDELMTEEERHEGGVDIYTTFDLKLQSVAESAVEGNLHQVEMRPGYAHPTRADFIAKHNGASEIPEPAYLQAAVSIIDNGSGAIRVLVGGRDFNHSRFNRATQSRRQVGSILKPLVYATAFETGIFPGTLVDDSPIRHDEITWDSSGWDPQNADGKSLGLQEVAFGLVKSRNTMSVRVGERAGFEAVTTMMSHAGIAEKSELPFSPQIYIGNLGASLNSMVSAYSVFANEGWRYQPYFIERIERSTGEVIYDRTETPKYQVLSSGSSWLTSNILQDALQPGGTGELVRRLGFSHAAGGKTGTTNDFHDAWFMGYTSKLTAGVWVGMDQPERIVNGGYGGALALPIWAEIMNKAESCGYVFDQLPQSEEIIEAELCRYSGHLADESCRRLGCCYREEIPHPLLPRHICTIHNGETALPKTNDLTLQEKPGIFGKLKGILGQ